MTHIKNFQNFLLEGMTTVTKNDDDWSKVMRENSEAYKQVITEEVTSFLKKKFKIDEARIKKFPGGMMIMYDANYGGAPDTLKITLPSGSDVDSEKIAKETEKFLQKLIKTDSRIKGIETSKSYGEKPVARQDPYNDLWTVRWAPVFLKW
jgi:hypothetical protein